MKYQLLIFALTASFGFRFAADEIIYLCRSAPKFSKFKKITSHVGWVLIAVSVFYIMNGMKFI